MKKLTARLLAAVLCITALMSASAALAAEPSSATVTVSANDAPLTENAGKGSMVVLVTNKSDKPITLTSITPVNSAITKAQVMPEGSIYTIPAATGTASGTATIPISATLASSGSAAGMLMFEFSYEGSSAKPNIACSDYVISRAQNSTTDDSNKTETDTAFNLAVSSIDSTGCLVPNPAGDYGKAITLRMPLTCIKGGASDIRVTPVLDTSVEKFPFDIQLVDYTLTYPGYLGQGGVVDFTYNWTLSKKATVGVKKVDFSVSYRDNSGNLKTGTVSVFVNVEKGLAAAAEDAAAATPKLIIESYKLSSDKIFAGETFDLDFTLKNTSSEESISNLQIRIKDAAETASVVPASGGSNTLYVSKISRGDTSAQKISMQTAPDTDAKAYTLNVEFSYESGSTNKAYTATETISVPILQKIRIKCDDPVIYDEMAWINQSCAMYVKMYNMGRSTVYNCMIDVEGEGLKMEESYFGGNLTAGSTLSADFSVLASVAGDIEGAVVITYEDVYGEPNTERLPFTLSVMEEPVMDDTMTSMEPTEPERTGLPWWVWVLIALALCTGGFFGLRFLRSKRRRALEDD